MSALGHKRTFAVQKAMSALPPKADICSAPADVCFVPKAEDHLLSSACETVVGLRDDGNKLPSSENARPSTFKFD